MRCCASPTTSIAADPRQREERFAARDVASAVLFREILKPLAGGLGPVGEIALGAVADDLFARRPR
jgi:hypothetical protein